MTDDAYDGLAADYHWLLSDDVLSGVDFLRLYGDVIDTIPPEAAVLDCSCGVGADAVALARMGFQVWATDASAGMAEQARRRVALAGEDIPVSVCRWDRLPAAFGRRFAAVFCVGNSLPHAMGADAMAAALAGMNAVLEPGGVLVVNSRDWALLRRERPRITAARQVVSRDGARCSSLYFWTLPPAWDEPHVADIVLLLERDGAVESRHHEIRFVPFSREELEARVRAAGFDQVRIDDQGGDRYRLCARKSTAVPAAQAER